MVTHQLDLQPNLGLKSTLSWLLSNICSLLLHKPVSARRQSAADWMKGGGTAAAQIKQPAGDKRLELPDCCGGLGNIEYSKVKITLTN